MKPIVGISIIVIFASVWTLIGALVIAPPTTPSSRVSPPTNGSTITQPSSPQLVLNLSGSGDSVLGMGTKSSQTFHISKSEWYIDTTCNTLDSELPLVLNAIIYRQGQPPENFLGVIGITSSGSDKNYFHASGDFYIEVMVVNVQAWTLKVYE